MAGSIQGLPNTHHRATHTSLDSCEHRATLAQKSTVLSLGHCHPKNRHQRPGHSCSKGLCPHPHPHAGCYSRPHYLPTPPFSRVMPCPMSYSDSQPEPRHRPLLAPAPSLRVPLLSCSAPCPQLPSARSLPPQKHNLHPVCSSKLNSSLALARKAPDID